MVRFKVMGVSAKNMNAASLREYFAREYCAANGGMCRIATITFDPTSGQRSYSNFMKFLGAQNCRGKADTLKLQSKISNSAAEQTGLRHYMTSIVDCKGVGIVAN